MKSGLVTEQKTMKPINKSQTNKTHEKIHFGKRTGILIIGKFMENEVSSSITKNKRESNKYNLYY